VPAVLFSLEFLLDSMVGYRDLGVWSDGVDLALEIYSVTNAFPKDERFGLTQQMRRSAVSVPCNIAEGRGRHSPNEWRHFLGIARGSLLELETQILIAEGLNFLPREKAEELVRKTQTLTAGINRLAKTLKP
jgi:four helix bundle protein